MANKISVSKAARLLQIQRSELQQRLLNSNIPTFEGAVDLDELRSIAPEISLCESDMLERVRFIRENDTRLNAVVTHNLDVEELAGEVRRLATDLMVERRTVDNYERILVALARRLGELQAEGSNDQRQLAFELCEWLRGEMATE